MMRTSLVLPVVAIVLAGSSPAHSATPNALNIAPEKPLFVAAMKGLDALERRLENSADRLGELGFEDPGIDTLRTELLRELGIKKKTFFDALGLASDGAVAIYITEPDDDAVVIALDVGDQKQFESILTHMIKENATSFYNPEPKTPKLKKERLGDGGKQLTFTLDDKPTGPIIRYYGKLALVASKDTSFDKAIDLKSGRKPAAFSKLEAGAESTAFVARFTPPKDSKERFARSLARNLEDIRFGMSVNDEGPRLSAEVTITPFALEKLSFMTPNPDSQATRDTMAKIAGTSSPLWSRASFTPEQMLRAARTFLGKTVDEAIKEVYDETKIRLDDDILGVITGDLMTGCNESLADCVIVLGVTDTKRAKKTVDKLLSTVAKQQAELHFETEKSGSRGAVVYSTTAFEQAPDKRGKPKRGAERTDRIRFHWGIGNGLLVFGPTPQGIRTALSARQDSTPRLPPGSAGLDATNPGYDDKTIMAGYARASEVFGLIHQVMPTVRASLPTNEWTGMAVRALDLMLVLADQTIDSGFSLRRRGLTWSMNAASAMLPKPRGPEQTALASQFTEALKHRYAGRLRSAKEILLEIVQKPGDSAWHRKAKTLLMESDSILMQFFNIALGPLFIGGATVGAFEQYQRAAQEKVWMERNARDCEEVKRRRCGGPHKDERDCSVGQAGDPLNCQDVLRRLEFE